MLSEEWRTIEGYSQYAVSNYGRVINTRSNLILKSRISNRGYERVGLIADKKPRAFSIHRLVAIAFIPNPNDLDQVNHIDGEKTNNCVNNLEWSDQSHNMLHAFRTGLREAPNRRAVRIVENGEEFPSIHACARAIGGIPQGVHHCITGKRPTYLGYTFQYV